MNKRALGKTRLSIAPLVLGGNVFGWTVDERQSFAVLDAFVDYGFDAIDTADVYSAWVPGSSGGESETIIGNWLKVRPGMRGKVTIFTKVWSDRAPLMTQDGVTAPIASATSTEQIDSFAKAASLTLSADDLAILDSASNAGVELAKPS